MLSAVEHPAQGSSDVAFQMMDEPCVGTATVGFLVNPELDHRKGLMPKIEFSLSKKMTFFFFSPKFRLQVFS